VLLAGETQEEKGGQTGGWVGGWTSGNSWEAEGETRQPCAGRPVPYLCDEAAVHEVAHPLRGRLPIRQRQLHFQHSVGKASDLGAVDGQAGVAVPAPEGRRSGVQGRWARMG
jgi:hypothetical protein